MNKEIEKWIEENNPYEVEVFPDPMDPFMYLGGIEDDTKKKMWAEGAKAMAEHLEEISRTENDTAFLLGMESAKGVQLFGIEQPPTENVIIKICNLIKSKYGFIDFNQDIKDYILEHWSDE